MDNEGKELEVKNDEVVVNNSNLNEVPNTVVPNETVGVVATDISNEPASVTSTDVSNETKEVSSNNNNVDDKKKDNSSKKRLIILGIIFVIVCVVCVVLFFLNKDTDEGGSYVSDEEYEQEDVDVAIRNVREFSEYRNFTLNYTATDGSNTAAYKVDVDLINKKAYVTVTEGLVYKYIYFDFISNVQYFSVDNVTWFKSTNAQVSLPNYENVIDEIKNNTDIVDNGNGQFAFRSSVKAFDNLFNNVPVTVNFNNNGFMSKVVYDLTEVDKGSVTYEFNNINGLNNVEIPTNVVNKATETTAVIMLDF